MRTTRGSPHNNAGPHRVGTDNGMDNHHNDFGDLHTIPDGRSTRHYSGHLCTSPVQHTGDSGDDVANVHLQAGLPSAFPPKGEQAETFLLTRFS